MSQVVNVNFRLDENDKKNMEQVCSELGLSLSAAFTIFAKKVGREKRIPFEVSVDPFYSRENISMLERRYADAKAGLNMHEHELIEEEKRKKYGRTVHGKTISIGKHKIKKL